MIDTLKNILLGLFLPILLIINTPAQAQNVAIGVNVGLMNYIGELAPDISIGTVLKETRPLINGYIRFRVKPKWHQRCDLTFGNLYADDDNHRQYLGGTSMKTFVMDAAWAVEHNFKPYRENTANQQPIPFGFIGFNTFLFKPHLINNPDREDMDVNEKLQVNVGINLGVGLKGKIAKEYSYNLVVRHTSTFTDNLEGFRTDTSSSPDFFTTIMVGIARNFKLVKKKKKDKKKDKET